MQNLHDFCPGSSHVTTRSEFGRTEILWVWCVCNEPLAHELVVIGSVTDEHLEAAREEMIDKTENVLMRDF